MHNPPGVRDRRAPLDTTVALFAADPLTRLTTDAAAAEVLAGLDRVLGPGRPDSELALVNAVSVDHGFSAAVSPALADTLRCAQHAESVTGGWWAPVTTADPDAQPPALDFEPHSRRLTLPPGAVLDLHVIACAWAAEQILDSASRADPFAALVVRVGPAVAAVGAAWEITEALDGELTVLDAALQRGQRSFAILEADAVLPPSPAPGRSTSERVWGGVTVAADDVVAAVAMADAAERLGLLAPEWIEAVGGQAELRGAPGAARPDRLPVRTTGWAPRSR